jgi:hypothetical protein
MTAERGLFVCGMRRDDPWSVAKRRLLSVEAIPGWVLYVFGLVELVAAWPRPVGLTAIALGLLDHARGVRRAWREAAG